MEITRTFDIIDLNVEKYPRKDMYAGNRIRNGSHGRRKR